MLLVIGRLLTLPFSITDRNSRHVVRDTLVNDLTAKVLMADPNPYARPKTQPASSGDSPSQLPRRSRFVYFILPAFTGAVLGGIFLAPFCSSVGDPGGHSIGAGLGGLAALLVRVVLRIKTSSTNETK